MGVLHREQAANGFQRHRRHRGRVSHAVYDETCGRSCCA
jgi:hypothetical protein